MNAVLDAGALVAVDRRDRRAAAMLRVLQRRHVPLRTSATVVAQVWRDGRRQANLARVLRGVGIEALDAADGRSIGALLAAADRDDVVDGHVALLVEPGGAVLTGDPSDIAALVAERRIEVRVLEV